MQTSEPICPEWFDKDIIKCPTCRERYERMEFDREQIVCPRCINKEWIDEEVL